MVIVYKLDSATRIINGLLEICQIAVLLKSEHVADAKVIEETRLVVMFVIGDIHCHLFVQDGIVKVTQLP
jgi:hypothetical protein